MSQPQLEIQALAVVVAAACALPGCFLLLRRMALMSDAISHSILLGIVVAFFVVGDISSPLLVVGAALMGLVTVAAVEALASTRRVANDAAIGLVFPALFSLAVVLIARYADQVHLDVDAVLLGEIAFTPFERLVVGGWDLGPQALWIMGTILAVNLAAVSLLFKELKVATFDPALAAALGFSPALLHYGLMSLVSVTAVGAFDAVGSVLVVALMIVPPATAYLLTTRLEAMLVVAVGAAASSALAGFWAAHFLDASIAGSMATVAGVQFALALTLAPGRGVVARARRRAAQRVEFAQAMLAIHLLHHEDLPEAARENTVAHLQEGLHWDEGFTREVLRAALRAGLVVEADGRLSLTERGRSVARERLAA